MSVLRTEFRDDPEISDAEGLWRRVAPNHVKFDLSRRRYRPSSVAFRHKHGEISVNLRSRTTPATSLASRPGFSLAEIEAVRPRRVGYGVISDEKPDNPAHALVVVHDTPRRIQKRNEKYLALRSTWIVLDLQDRALDHPGADP
jgi:hypothetical protein